MVRFRTLDEAIDRAWDTFREYVQMKFTYLLPVEVVEGTRDEAERGKGYVWWTNGKRKAPPVDPRQTRMFGDRRRSGKMIREDLWVVEGGGARKRSVVYGPERKKSTESAYDWFRRFFPGTRPEMRRAKWDEMHGVPS